MALIAALSCPLPYALGAMAAATAFAGIGVHLSTTEAQVKNELSASEALHHFQLSYPILKVRQVGLLLITAAGGVAAGILSKGLTRNLFLGGAALSISVIPYTYLALIPINNLLLSTPLTEATHEHQDLLQKWALLNWVRPALTVASVLAFCAGITLFARR